jgi:hypothetical protein
MMTTNKLTKTFASGSLAIGVLAGSVFTATSASAMIMVNWSDFKSGTPISEGDKQVKLTSYVNGGSIDLSNTPSIPVMVVFGDVGGGEYRLSILGELNGPADTFTYEISILDAFPNNYFTGAQLDSDVNVNSPLGYGTITKEVIWTGGSVLLTSINGDPDPDGAFFPIPGGLRTLTVTDTLIPNPGGSLTSLSNKFTQGTKVPEPGTILGLLAVGGLGLVSRFGKQK